MGEHVSGSKNRGWFHYHLWANILRRPSATLTKPCTSVGASYPLLLLPDCFIIMR